MLEKWIYEGIIDDPYDEFMIREDDSIEKGLSGADIGDLYWRKRYSCRREQFPVFLEKVSEKVLTTGKFLNVVRECGRPIDCPVATSLSYTTNDREYVEKIDAAFGFASSLLLRLFMDDMCLMERLEYVSHLVDHILIYFVSM
jgi:gamma-tubulin complex component 2